MLRRAWLWSGVPAFVGLLHVFAVDGLLARHPLSVLALASILALVSGAMVSLAVCGVSGVVAAWRARRITSQDATAAITALCIMGCLLIFYVGWPKVAGGIEVGLWLAALGAWLADRTQQRCRRRRRSL
jgi:hypothetical protein